MLLSSNAEPNHPGTRIMLRTGVCIPYQQQMLLFSWPVGFIHREPIRPIILFTFRIVEIDFAAVEID